MKTKEARKGKLDTSPVIPEVVPEFRPAIFRRTADVDVGVIGGLLVFHAVLVPGVAREPAGFEALVHIRAVEADHDDRLRRRVSVAAIPEGIDAADGAGQSVLRAVEVDGSRFAVIRADDSQVRALFGSERIANLRYLLHQFGPADFFAVVSLHMVGDGPPARVHGGGRHPES